MRKDFQDFSIFIWPLNSSSLTFTPGFYVIRRKQMLRSSWVKQGWQCGKKKATGYEAASRVFGRIVYNDPQGVLAPEALLAQGGALYAAGRFAEAAKAYERLLTYHSESEWVNAAKIRAAKSLLMAPPRGKIQSGTIDRAERLLNEAREVILRGDKALESELGDARALLREKRARHLMERAEFYLENQTRAGNKPAVFLLEELVKDYSGTETAARAKKILQRLGKTGEE